MSEQVQGVVWLDGLDGARERAFELPANWHNLTEDEQDDVARAIKRELMEDSVSWSWTAPASAGCDCYGCVES